MAAMNCQRCGSSIFQECDGITYCVECEDQIKESCNDKQTEEFGSQSTEKSVPAKRVGNKTKIYDSWISAECFNIIIYKQVSSLIKLGASPKLKKTVLYIWSKYLQKCEIAFREDYRAKDGKPCLGTVAYKRDMKVLYGDKSAKKEVKRKRKRTSSIKSESVSSDNETVGEESRGNKEQSSFTECNSGVSRFSSDETELLEEESSVHRGQSSDTECNSEDSKLSSHARKLRRVSGRKKTLRYKKAVFNMSLSKTLSFCYLGLLYTEDQLSLSDLIRFAYEDKIPYVNILDKLPPSFKLQNWDTRVYLTYVVPDAQSILKTSHDIVQFLKLPKFKEPSVFLAAAHYLKDLNLPDDLKPIIKILYEQYKERLSKSSRVKKTHLEYVPHDYQALSLVIVALKMLFILDDKFEIEHSEVMAKLNSVKPSHKYFIWTEWKRQALLKEYLFLSDNPGYCSINKFDILSADKILSKYPYTCLKAPSGEGLLKGRNSLDSMYKIKNMLSELVHISSDIDRVPTSFPFLNEINRFEKEWKSLHMFKNTKEIDFHVLKEDFTSHSLGFNPAQYNTEEEELSYLLMSSLYLPEISVDTYYKHYQPIECHCSVIRTTSKYWFLNTEKRSKSSDLSSDWLDKVPTSFRWLINFICKYSYLNCSALYKEIIEIEKLLFLQKERVRSQILPTYNNKIIVDF